MQDLGLRVFIGKAQATVSTSAFEPGQLDEPCVWIPPEPGDVTIRARITYRVRYVVSGFVEEQPAYEWESDPLTVRVDELRAVNTRPGS